MSSSDWVRRSAASSRFDIKICVNRWRTKKSSKTVARRWKIPITKCQGQRAWWKDWARFWKSNTSRFSPRQNPPRSKRSMQFFLQSSWCSQHYCHFWELADGATHFILISSIKFNFKCNSRSDKTRTPKLKKMNHSRYSLYYRFFVKDRELDYTSAQRSQVAWQILVRCAYDRHDKEKVFSLSLQYF